MAFRVSTSSCVTAAFHQLNRLVSKTFCSMWIRKGSGESSVCLCDVFQRRVGAGKPGVVALPRRLARALGLEEGVPSVAVPAASIRRCGRGVVFILQLCSVVGRIMLTAPGSSGFCSEAQRFPNSNHSMYFPFAYIHRHTAYHSTAPTASSVHQTSRKSPSPLIAKPRPS